VKNPLTPGHWRVPHDLAGQDEWGNGVVVLGGTDGRQLIADCRGTVSRAEQLGNARMIAAIPALLELLHETELYLGDQPSSDREAMQLHRRVVAVIGRGR
jgi:hypothetical protein